MSSVGDSYPFPTDNPTPPNLHKPATPHLTLVQGSKKSMTDRQRRDRIVQQSHGQTTLWPIYAFRTSDGTARRHTYDEPRLKPRQRGAPPPP